MNNSGTAIKELIDYFKIDAKDVIVFHDDMDIDLVKLNKIWEKYYNGIESIDKFIGKDYSRVELVLVILNKKKLITIKGRFQRGWRKIKKLQKILLNKYPH